MSAQQDLPFDVDDTIPPQRAWWSDQKLPITAMDEDMLRLFCDALARGYWYNEEDGPHV